MQPKRIKQCDIPTLTSWDITRIGSERWSRRHRGIRFKTKQGKDIDLILQRRGLSLKYQVKEMVVNQKLNMNHESKSSLSF